MDSVLASDELAFQDAVAGLRHGDFSRLSPLFDASASQPPAIVQWHEQGRFRELAQESAEALTCACFLGALPVAEYLLGKGFDPSGGIGTGLNAFHWAANRGQLKAVRLLLQYRAPLEVRNAHGGTVLGGTVWAAIHEPKRDHLAILEELLTAGADVREAEYPTGDARLDSLLERFGAA